MILKPQKLKGRLDFATLLKDCVQHKDLNKGNTVHSDILQRSLERNPYLANSLVNLYVKCYALAEAQQVFDKLQERDVTTWNILIAGYVQHRHGVEALKCFQRMQLEGFPRNSITFICILKACGMVGGTDMGEEVHTEIIRDGWLEKEVKIGTALVDMYAKCGQLERAQKVFDKLQEPNVVSWTALISGYAHYGHGKEALICYNQMQEKGVSPSEVTIVCILKACGGVRAACKGEEIHAEIVKQGLLGKNMRVANALTDMYVKCEAISKAQEVFDGLHVRNVISWTTLISGYTQLGLCEEALNCYECMKFEGISPNAVTFACILKACGSAGAVGRGNEIHEEIIRNGCLENDVPVGNALVDMYAKCGVLDQAYKVFSRLQVRNLICWTALIAGYAQLGQVDIVFDLFDKMLSGGEDPNLITFTVVLNACGHSGLLKEGQMCFEVMYMCYGIVPTSEQYSCMVDLFGRAGCLEKAAAVIKNMQICESESVWTALSGACHKWGYVRLGELAFEHLVQLEEKGHAAYITMRNTYVAAGLLEDTDEVEVSRVKRQTEILLM